MAAQAGTQIQSQASGGSVAPFPDGGLTVRPWSLPGFAVQEVRAAVDSMVPWHRHELPCLVVLLSSGYEQIGRSRRFTCERNQLTLVPAGEPHREEIAKGAWGLLAFPVEAGSRSRTPDAVSPTGPIKPESARVAALLDRWEHVTVPPGMPFGELRRELGSPDAATALVLEARLLETIAVLVRERGRERRVVPPWLLEVHERIQDEFYLPLTVAGLAADVGVTGTRLARLYRKHFRRSISEVVRERRLERARHLLAASDLPIVEIALDVGLCDQSHLNRRFRERFGETPLVYRNRMRDSRKGRAC